MPTEWMFGTRSWCMLPLHLYRVWRGGQLRFRLETFGLYYPALPYQSPWWRISPGTAWLLVRRLAAYVRWVEEMETVQRGGGAAWWNRFERDGRGQERG
jgi:hypothetical protein